MKDEILSIEETVVSPKEEFMVFVQGRNAPNVIHETWESAEKEAIRLASLYDNRHQKIFVVKVVDVLVPVSSHRWIKAN